MEIPRSTAACACSQVVRQLCLGTGRKCSSLLVTNMDPFNIFVVMNSIDNAIQRVTNNAVNAANSGRNKRIHQVYCYSCHTRSSLQSVFLTAKEFWLSNLRLLECCKRPFQRLLRVKKGLP